MSISKQVVQSFILGNEDAIGKVYDEYKNLMYFIIASYISLPEDCEDVLSESFIKQLHYILKYGTSDSRKAWFAVGDYKRFENEVGGSPTTKPENVSKEMKQLSLIIFAFSL